MGAEEARIAADSIEEGKRLVRVQSGGLSLADRRRLAAELARDREAMAALASADPELARQLQADVKAFQRMQTPGKGLGRGLRPKR